MWVWVNLPYACFGIKVTCEKVVDAAPIAGWMIGKDTKFIRDWIVSKGGKYVCLTPDENA